MFKRFRARVTTMPLVTSALEYLESGRKVNLVLLHADSYDSNLATMAELLVEGLGNTGQVLVSVRQGRPPLSRRRVSARSQPFPFPPEDGDIQAALSAICARDCARDEYATFDREA